MPSLITLTTDFGVQDAYVAAMKGVMLSLTPRARLVDITHEIGPHDVMEAAFVLRSAWSYYPEGTVHLVVVDPGVGTERRAIALSAGGHLFVGPDNGLFTLLLHETPVDEVVELCRPSFWRTPTPSRTFHGRDVFAPVAAHLAAGRALREVGPPAGELKRLHWALPIADDQGVQGYVAHIDRFGNCITNISRSVLDAHRAARQVKCYAGGAILNGIRSTYGDVAPGEPLLLFGSTNHLEVAVHAGNAAELLSIREGASVNVVFLDDSSGPS